MGSTIGDKSKRTLFLVSLAVLGIVYSIVATRIWMVNWVPLLPLMSRAFIFRMLLGPWWYGIELAPITIAVILLRLRFEQAIGVIFAFFVIMNVAQLIFEPFGVALLLSMVGNTPFCLAIQVPVWALTAMVVKLACRDKTQTD